MNFIAMLKRLFQEDDGTTAVEYGVMLALILVAMIAAIASAGSGVSGWWSDIDTELDASGF